MELTVTPCYLYIVLFFFAFRVTPQKCGQNTSPSGTSYPNCTEANTAFCEGGPIIFRCFFPYGVACPGNCMDNLDENYRDANCWESAPGAGDGQCAAQCVSVTAKNGTVFYPYGCDQVDASSVTQSPMSTSTSAASTSTTNTLPIQTTTTQPSSATATKSSGSTKQLNICGFAIGMGGLLGLAAHIVN